MIPPENFFGLDILSDEEQEKAIMEIEGLIKKHRKAVNNGKIMPLVIKELEEKYRVK